MSLLSRVAEIVLRLKRFKRQFASAYGLHRMIAKDRKAGHATPSARMRRRLRVDATHLGGREVYSVAPKDGGSGTRVLYFHGGSYVLDLLKYHWHMVERLVAESGATFIVPRYPLAPESSHQEVLAFARALYTEVRPDALMGDSAGAGLGLALAQLLRDANDPQPRLLILLSPWLDVTMSDPKLVELDPLDPMLGIPGSIEAGRLYARRSDPRDPSISPIYGRFDWLPPMMVLTGTHDILHADALRFKERCAIDGCALEWVQGTDMIHDWPLVVTLPEARVAIGQMAARVRSL